MPLGWPKDEKGTPVSTKVVSTRLRLSMTPMQLGPTTRMPYFSAVRIRRAWRSMPSGVLVSA